MVQVVTPFVSDDDVVDGAVVLYLGSAREVRGHGSGEEGGLQGLALLEAEGQQKDVYRDDAARVRGDVSEGVVQEDDARRPAGLGIGGLDREVANAAIDDRYHAGDVGRDLAGIARRAPGRGGGRYGRAAVVG